MADQWERQVAVYSARNAELAAENERLRRERDYWQALAKSWGDEMDRLRRLASDEEEEEAKR